MAHRHAGIRQVGSSALGTRDEKVLASDERTLLAVSHAIQIIGEAANHVSVETRTALAEIPWVDVIGMRHHLVHGYRARSVRLIAQTIQEDLPLLIAILERSLKDQSQ